ncbi:hypothetical protein DFH27DRAFT_475783 [Peziza echinospora]|nr:hypothetical protein DFH27DRAFT_475783 [Peziza echinospora]
MESQWAQSTTPFSPVVGKELHSTVAFVLISSALVLTGFFSLNKSPVLAPVLAIPASLAFGFGAVYLICAAGVYV